MATAPEASGTVTLAVSGDYLAQMCQKVISAFLSSIFQMWGYFYPHKVNNFLSLLTLKPTEQQPITACCRWWGVGLSW